MTSRGCGCRQATDRRINEVTGESEVSFDGGITWSPDLEDPRQTAPILPLPPGTPLPDSRCSGAISVANVYKIILDRLIANTAAWDDVIALVGGIISALLGLFGPVGAAIAAIVAGVAVLLFTLGRTAAIAALDTAAYTELKCCVYCNISQDASFTDLQIFNLKVCLTDMTNQTAGLIFWWMTIILGKAYLTNAARLLPTAGADCSECDCGECVDPTTSGPQAGTNLIPRPDLGFGWWEVTTVEYPPGGGSNFYAEIQTGCCRLDDYQVVAPGVNASPGNRVAIGCGGSPFHSGDYGLNQCVELILFRSFGVATFEFKLITCV